MTMRNRKTVIVAFMLVVCMILAVGFANLTDSLEISGTAEITKNAAEAAFDADVYFTDAVAITNGNTTSINSDNNDKVSFTASSLAAAGDTAVFKYEVSNFNDLKAVIKATDIDANVTTFTDDEGNVTTADASIFKIEYQWDKTTIDAVNAGGDPGVAYVTVTVTLLETPEVYTKGTFTLTISVISEN